MSLPSPNLDDRTFDDLVRAALERVGQTCPEWTDLSPGDPGRALLEAFAHITETMIYRLNRLPDKVYEEFLNLMGVRPYPPTAACALLRFTRSDGSKGPIEIPVGIRVAVGRSGGAGDALVFITADSATLQDGKETADSATPQEGNETADGATLQEAKETVDVVAHHCEWVQGERVDLRTGQHGKTAQLSCPPVIADTGTEVDLKVAVEARRDEMSDGVKTLPYKGKTYRVWREVTGFLGYEADECVYVVDRYSGQITFPGKSPPRGREIRAWYAHGGGPAGNVRAGALTLLRDPIPGIGSVTNPSAATGGRAAETLEDMRLYGPQGIHCQERAVTARDFETLARRASGEVARARAIAQAELWKHGEPGTVEVLLVPDVPAKERGPEGQVTSVDIDAKRIPAVRTQVQDYLDARRPMGMGCDVKWAQLKTVSVSATVIVRPKENLNEVARGVRERLYQYINPLPTMTAGSGNRPTRRLSGWPFGRSLHVSSVHAEVLAVEGVRRVQGLDLIVENMPDGHVTALTSDHLTGIWYAACGNRLFRSQNDGDGWELLKWFAEDESIELVRAHPRQAGLVTAVATKGEGDKKAHRVYVSRDCGEEWSLEKGIDKVGEVHDIDWTTNKDGAPVLLLAAANGLYALAVNDGSGPQRVDVDPETNDLGFYAVAVAHNEARDRVSVAVAARNEGGVFLCLDWIRDCHFKPIEPTGKDILRGKDIRVLAVQRGEQGNFLWAGAYAEGPKDEGDGCYRRALDSTHEWEHFGQQKGWSGGSCRALAFLGEAAVAASHHEWALHFDAAETRWKHKDTGVPRREGEDDLLRGHPRLVTVLAAMETEKQATVLAGTEAGLYRSQDGDRYEKVSGTKEATSDKVTLPQTWLFCSGEHQITAEREEDEG